MGRGSASSRSPQGRALSTAPRKEPGTAPAAPSPCGALCTPAPHPELFLPKHRWLWVSAAARWPQPRCQHEQKLGWSSREHSGQEVQLPGLGWGQGDAPGAASASCCPGCHRATAAGCTDPQPPQKMGSALLGFALLGEQNSSPGTDCCCLPGASQIRPVPQTLSGTLTLGFPCLLAVTTSSLCSAAPCCLPQDSMPAARSHPSKARAASRAAATGSSAGDRSNL